MESRFPTSVFVLLPHCSKLTPCVLIYLCPFLSPAAVHPRHLHTHQDYTEDFIAQPFNKRLFSLKCEPYLVITLSKVFSALVHSEIWSSSLILLRPLSSLAVLFSALGLYTLYFPVFHTACQRLPLHQTSSQASPTQRTFLSPHLKPLLTMHNQHQPIASHLSCDFQHCLCSHLTTSFVGEEIDTCLLQGKCQEIFVEWLDGPVNINY